MNNANINHECHISNCHFCSFHINHCLYSFILTRWRSVRAEKHVTVRGKNRIVRGDDAVATRMKKQHPPIVKSAVTIRPSDKQPAGAHDVAAGKVMQKAGTKILKALRAPAAH